ncbi:hypothetical protein GCM10010510_24110 [Streptomyces anandii JCM 4720]|nr:hypothetical protein GCM10010510_24110 [Streptomyces anandii JCM 4720]
MLPRDLADPAVAAGSLEARHQAQVQPFNTLYLVTPSGPPPPPVALVHRRLLRQARSPGPL